MSEPPSRTLGVAFSDGDRVSRIAGAVLRADATLDGLAYGACTVGGTDATDAVVDLVADLDRQDVRHVCIAGVAPAWFNLLDLRRIHEAVGRPVSAVSYEASPGLEPALREALGGGAGDADADGLAERLAVYRSLPPRRRVALDGPASPLFVRAVGLADDRAAAIVRSLVREGFRRPEPLRIASIAAGAHREAVPDDPSL
ncbi:endonuclease dU [Halorubrum halodurans]|uniref:Uncharacterized protein n=1 Tax=Halorubrum halodurans TaxID=1383851 RepID=A0A256IS27_9EURY|nr:DUF99 family protein [Halorubrum halodurans]OYR59380.1 hypothetical protein DJ70_00420 [Halorubrum halodurans]